MGVIPIESSTRSRTCLTVTINWTGGTKKTSALLDSGAEESFLDTGATGRWGIPLLEVSHPLVANSLNGQRLGRITKATKLTPSSGVREPSRDHLTPDHRHTSFACGAGPSMDGEAQPWNGLEVARDLFDELSPEGPFLDFSSSARGDSEPSYHNLGEVFSKSRATCLPPHRPCDCEIELQSGTTSPRGCLFSLSWPETAAMDKYLCESLAAGIIRPSSSPEGAGFSRRTDLFDPALIIAQSMKLQSRIDTRSHWWQWHWNSCRGRLSSPSWTCGMPITSSGSEKEMSGRRPSIWPWVTGNI